MDNHIYMINYFSSSKVQRKIYLPGEPGIWVFVLGDMVVFGLFFAVYFYYRALNPALFLDSQKTLDQNIGAINTLLLMTSSWLVVMGVKTARAKRGSAGSRWFALAFLCGLGFAINKIFEYQAKIESGITLTTNDFYMYYFVLTGIHLGHVIFGLCALVFMWNLSRSHMAGEHDQRSIESCATFWHLVDVLWIVLFPLLYLVS